MTDDQVWNALSERVARYRHPETHAGRLAEQAAQIIDDLREREARLRERQVSDGRRQVPHPTPPPPLRGCTRTAAGAAAEEGDSTAAAAAAARPHGMRVGR